MFGQHQNMYLSNGSSPVMSPAPSLSPVPAHQTLSVNSSGSSSGASTPGTPSLAPVNQFQQAQHRQFSLLKRLNLEAAVAAAVASGELQLDGDSSFQGIDLGLSTQTLPPLHPTQNLPLTHQLKPNFRFPLQSTFLSSPHASSPFSSAPSSANSSLVSSPASSTPPSPRSISTPYRLQAPAVNGLSTHFQRSASFQEGFNPIPSLIGEDVDPNSLLSLSQRPFVLEESMPVSVPLANQYPNAMSMSMSMQQVSQATNSVLDSKANVAAILNMPLSAKSKRKREKKSKRGRNSCHVCKCGMTDQNKDGSVEEVDHVRCRCGLMYCGRSRCCRRLNVLWPLFKQALANGQPCVHCVAMQQIDSGVLPVTVHCPNSNCKLKKRKWSPITAPYQTNDSTHSVQMAIPLATIGALPYPARHANPTPASVRPLLATTVSPALSSLSSWA
jgi:hypothetical protein